MTSPRRGNGDRVVERVWRSGVGGAGMAERVGGKREQLWPACY